MMTEKLKYTVFIISIIISVTALGSAQNNSNPLPNLRGEAAINKLKEIGQYHNLMDAVRQSRQKDRQAINTPTGDANGAISNQRKTYVLDVLGTIWTQEAQKVASDGIANDNFGRSVAISGNTAIVGAFFDDGAAGIDQGSAYIFVRSGTTWNQQAKLLASDAAANDTFGNAVAIHGDTVIVGANLADVGANIEQGAAYIFVRSGVTWSQQAKITATNGAVDDRFGTSVAISGDSVVVGAYFDDVSANTDQGSAYVFTRSGVIWTQQAQLTATGGAMNDQFGVSVGIDGNTAIVGAYRDMVGANPDQGSAYVFTRSGVSWTQQAQLNASDGGMNDQFGISVGISGETVIVGASLDDVGASTNQGSVYIFTRSGIVWTQQQKLNSSDGAANDVFGSSVSISGDAIVIGAYLADVGGNNDQGAAYVFERAAAVWTQKQKLTASGGAAIDQFGLSAAISGDKIIVGAPNSDASTSIPLVPQFADQGAAFIFINDLIPTAANVSISGRVITQNGAGLRNAIVSLTKPNGETILTRTTSFGYYRFDEVESGKIYIISVISKRFIFAPQAVQVNENISDLDFTAVE